MILPKGETGASALLVAASLLLLFGLAAIALDAGGMGFNERRQDQSAADVGALAAIQFAVPQDLGNPGCVGYSGITLSRCNGAVEAIAVANATLDDPTQANWTNAALCSSPPSGFTVSPITSCVAFTSNNQRAWVRIPTISKPTTFARVLGITNIAVSAEAIAGTSIGSPGGVLPFLLPGNATGTDYNCLKTGGNPSFGVCDDLPSTGNFGSMDFFLYGNADIGSTEKCSGDTNGRLLFNIARGVDHPLGKHPTGSGSGKEDPAHCPDFGAEPDMVQGQSGVGSALEDGLLYGDSSYSTTGPYPGRIEDPTGFNVRSAQGSTPEAWIDNTPLWDYLKPNLGSFGGVSCNRTDPPISPVPPTDVDTPQEMIDCIAKAKQFAGGTEIFMDSLVSAKRFGWTPEVWEDDFETPGYYYHIKEYRPVYIDTTMFACTATTCRIMYTPGVADSGSCPPSPDPMQITCGTPGPGNRTLVAVTAYVLSQEIVPEIAKTPAPGATNQRSYNLTR